MTAIIVQSVIVMISVIIGYALGIGASNKDTK